MPNEPTPVPRATPPLWPRGSMPIVPPRSDEISPLLIITALSRPTRPAPFSVWPEPKVQVAAVPPPRSVLIRVILPVPPMLIDPEPDLNSDPATKLIVPLLVTAVLKTVRKLFSRMSWLPAPRLSVPVLALMPVAVTTAPGPVITVASTADGCTPQLQLPPVAQLPAATSQLQVAASAAVGKTMLASAMAEAESARRSLVDGFFTMPFPHLTSPNRKPLTDVACAAASRPLGQSPPASAPRWRVRARHPNRS